MKIAQVERKGLHRKYLQNLKLLKFRNNGVLNQWWHHRSMMMYTITNTVSLCQSAGEISV
jgi:hypothetical protein